MCRTNKILLTDGFRYLGGEFLWWMLLGGSSSGKGEWAHTTTSKELEISVEDAVRVSVWGLNLVK